MTVPASTSLPLIRAYVQDMRCSLHHPTAAKQTKTLNSFDMTYHSRRRMPDFAKESRQARLNQNASLLTCKLLTHRVTNCPIQTETSIRHRPSSAPFRLWTTFPEILLYTTSQFTFQWFILSTCNRTQLPCALCNLPTPNPIKLTD